MANALVDSSRFLCAVCYYGDSKKDKTFLLADLIIGQGVDKCASPRIDTIINIKRVSPCPSLVRVCDRKQGANDALAQMKCAVVANTDINLTVESSRML